MSKALEQVEAWLESPSVVLIAEGERICAEQRASYSICNVRRHSVAPASLLGVEIDVRDPAPVDSNRGQDSSDADPWLNHSWHVPLYVTARGLSTSVIPYKDEVFEIRFDFIDQTLDIDVSTGQRRRIRLMPQPVCDFYAAVMRSLADLGIEVHIRERPCEIPDAIPFSDDRTHASYDPDAAQRFWRALVQVDRVFKKFRTGFIGKASPVHFFWGSFDLAVTRFSGRRAPPFTSKVPGLSTAVMAEAYSHEVSSAGFWPGGGGIDYASFYSYAYPTPDGFKDAPVVAQGRVFR